jgi:hypothetical protein
MFTPPCSWLRCASIITSVVKVCFVGSKYGYLVVSLSGALSILPPYLTTQQVNELKMNLRKNMNQPKFIRIYISHRHKQRTWNVLAVLHSYVFSIYVGVFDVQYFGISSSEKSLFANC